MGPVGSLRPSCRLGHAVRKLCGSGSPPSRAVLLSCPPRSASLRRSLVGSSCAISKSSSLALPLSASSPSSRRASVRSMGAQGSSSAAPTETSVHEFAVKDIDGKDVSLSQYRGKVLLVVNVASQCGLTQSNYKELTELYTKYKDLGLEILAFPSNQFGSQEPGSNEEIKEFACSRFKAEFPIFDKVDVNGADAAPLYKFLKASKGSILGEAIKWNFTKFLVDRDGKVVNRYAPTTSPKSIEKDIKKELGVVAA